jgi:hypothetical protein
MRPGTCPPGPRTVGDGGGPAALFGTPDTDAFPAIRRGLGAPGYIEERNILFEHRYVEGGPELPAQLRHVRRCDH